MDAEDLSITVERLRTGFRRQIEEKERLSFLLETERNLCGVLRRENCDFRALTVRQAAEIDGLKEQLYQMHQTLLGYRERHLGTVTSSPPGFQEPLSLSIAQSSICQAGKFEDAVEEEEEEVQGKVETVVDIQVEGDEEVIPEKNQGNQQVNRKEVTKLAAYHSGKADEIQDEPLNFELVESFRKAEEERKRDLDAKFKLEIQRERERKAEQDVRNAAERKRKEAARTMKVKKTRNEKIVNNVLDTIISEAVVISEKKKQAPKVIQTAIRRIFAQLNFMFMRAEAKKKADEEARQQTEKMEAEQRKAQKQVETIRGFVYDGKGFPFINPLMNRRGTEARKLSFDELDLPIRSGVSDLDMICPRVFKERTEGEIVNKYQNIPGFPNDVILVQLKIQETCFNTFFIEQDKEAAEAGQRLYYVKSCLPVERTIISPSVSLATIATWFDNKYLQKACRAVYPNGLTYLKKVKTFNAKKILLDVYEDVANPSNGTSVLQYVRFYDGPDLEVDVLDIPKMLVMLPGQTKWKLSSIVEIMEWFARGMFNPPVKKDH